MEGFLVLVYVVMFVWGILNIILFFKIWGMTNNVLKLTQHFCEQGVSNNQKPQIQDTDPNAIKIGDKVINIETGEELVVKYIYPDGDVACNPSDGGVRKVFNKDKVKKAIEK